MTNLLFMDLQSYTEVRFIILSGADLEYIWKNNI